MKKGVLQSLVILLVFMLLIAGCGQKTETGSSAPQKQDQKAQSASPSAEKAGNEGLKVTLAGGSAGGLWSSIGEGIGETIKRAYQGTTFTYQPGQDGANVLTVSSGQANFGIVSAPAIVWAYKGVAPYKSKVENLRLVAYLHSMPYHFVVTEKSGIKSIDQIVSEKFPLVVAVGTKDSPMEIANHVVFKSYGTSYEQIEKNGGKLQYLATSKSNDQIKDGKMHGNIGAMPPPAASLLELNTSTPIRLLPLSDAAVKAMEEEMGCKPFTMKAGSYPFVKEDLKTSSMDTVLFTSADVPEDVVYKVTKAMYEQLDYLYTVHKTFKDINKDTIAKVSGAPLHLGAEKFYKEIGILK